MKKRRRTSPRTNVWPMIQCTLFCFTKISKQFSTPLVWCDSLGQLPWIQPRWTHVGLRSVGQPTRHHGRPTSPFDFHFAATMHSTQFNWRCHYFALPRRSRCGYVSKDLARRKSHLDDNTDHYVFVFKKIRSVVGLRFRIFARCLSLPCSEHWSTD